MGFMSKIKDFFDKSKSERESLEREREISGTPTRYGKKLNLNSIEKSELIKSLTPREKETFFILLEGYNLKEAAKLLNISYSTANTYQTAIYKKLHVNTRPELIINYRDVCKIREEQ